MQHTTFTSCQNAVCSNKFLEWHLLEWGRLLEWGALNGKGAPRNKTHSKGGAYRKEGAKSNHYGICINLLCFFFLCRFRLTWIYKSSCWCLTRKSWDTGNVMLSSLAGNVVCKIDMLNRFRLLRRHSLRLSRNDFPMCQRGVRDEPKNVKVFTNK